MTGAVYRRRLRSRLVRRLRRRWLEIGIIYLLALIGLALGGAFFVGSSSTLGSLDRAWDRAGLQAGSFTVPQQGTTPDGGIEADGIEAMPSADVGSEGDSTLRLIPPREDINRYEVVSGRDLEGPDEILLDAKFAEAHGLQEGSAVTAGPRTLTVVGLASVPEYIAVKNSQVVLQPNPDEFGIGVVTREAFRQIAPEPVVTWAYDDTWTPQEIVDTFRPVDVRDTANDSRVQQAIGDSAAPRDLAALIFVIFAAIVAAMLGVYHYQTRTQERRNKHALAQLGLDAPLRCHHGVDTRAALLLAGITATATMLLSVRPIMEINGQLYNYPRLDVDMPLLVLVALVGTAALLLIDALVSRLVAGRPDDGRGARAPRVRRPGLRGLRWIPDFGYRLRLVRVLRRPGEFLAVAALVLIVSVFASFSLLLKVSVDEWRAALSDDTPYEVMYTVNPAQAARVQLRDGDEKARLLTLYDDAGIAQMVYVVPEDSRFFGTLDGPAATTAFYEKFGLRAGDAVRLTRIDGEEPVSLTLTETVQNGTSAFLYIPSSQAMDLLGDRPAADVVFADREHPDLEGVAPTVRRGDIVSAGESITRIIGMQVALLLAVAAVLLGMMLFAIYRFTMGNQVELIRTLRREGRQAGEIVRALFGLSFLVAVACGVFALAASSGAVRAFFDTIMFRFVNFVPVTGSSWVPLLVVGGTVVALAIMSGAAFIRVRRTRGQV